MRELATVERDAVVGGTENAGKGGNNHVDCDPLPWIGFPNFPSFPILQPVGPDLKFIGGRPAPYHGNKNNHPSC